jgi:hypothetical protein
MAAGSTYTKIPGGSVALSSASSVTFSSIPATYTDLRIVIVGAVAAGLQNLTCQFNGDTSTNYSRTFMASTGGSGRESTFANITLDRYGYFSSSTTNMLVDVMNYSNTTTYKTLLSRSNNASEGTGLVVGMWRNTTAINSILLTLSGSTWTTGSVASLYGIAAA